MLDIRNCDNMLLMAEFPDKYFDLALIDPPYGINMSMGHKGSEKRGDKNRYKNFSGNDACIPSKEFFKELFRVSKNQIIWGGNYMIEHLFPTSCFIVWDKCQPQEFSMAMCEFAWTSFNSPAKIIKKRVVGADDFRFHPTQKPVYLYRWLLNMFAEPGMKILDTHLGSGNIAIASHYFGTDLVACELNEEYYNLALKNISQNTIQEVLF